MFILEPDSGTNTNKNTNGMANFQPTMDQNARTMFGTVTIAQTSRVGHVSGENRRVENIGHSLQNTDVRRRATSR